MDRVEFDKKGILKYCTHLLLNTLQSLLPVIESNLQLPGGLAGLRQLLLELSVASRLEK